ncbi:MAG: pyridoxal-phosphate dependent enzyme [Sedimentisphaerales bacterium]|nr:pyridoxal-phosphate dependent enzyme [Sedimentisphaerales bacterium]
MSIDLPRYSLAHLPSPLIPMQRLALKLEVDSLYIKRDDLLGRILGGNKLRKLEYIIPLARKDGADTLITAGSFESNHVCLTAAVARMLDMQAAMVLMGPAGRDHQTFNEKIQQQLGVETRVVEYVEGDQ